MPRADSDSVIARQWQLLRLLPPKRPGESARGLCERLADHGFRVSKRTVERDLQTLSRIFPIAINDKGMPQGWHWMPEASLDLPGIALSDALSLTLIEDLLRPLLPASMLGVLAPRFDEARRKLTALSQAQPMARWHEKVRYVQPTFPLKPPSVDPDILESIHNALLDDRQIDVTYRKPGDDRPRSLRLHPLGIVQRGNATYLVATAFQYTDPRIYAVHRITSAEPREEAITPPPDFDLDHYIDAAGFEFGDRREIRLVARLSDALAAVLAETPIAEDQRIDTDELGRATLHVTTRDTWQLRWWLLSQGPGIVVEEPGELRDWIRQTITEMNDNYED